MVSKIENFFPLHMTGTKDDLAGNNGINRYIFLCGSDERAKRIASFFDNDSLVVKNHPRQHNLYLGTIKHQNRTIDVASISTGMGCPNADIIMNELYQLGGRRFLRVGTAGSLQPYQIKVGDVVIATSAVRDEDTSACYVAPEYPAVASIEMINASLQAAEALSLEHHVFPGIVHTKSSFYAREMNMSHLKHNTDYMDSLMQAGVLASEMECSHLFVLASLMSHREYLDTQLPQNRVLAGAILAIIGDHTPISSEELADIAVERAIKMSFETIKKLASYEIKKYNIHSDITKR